MRQTLGTAVFSGMLGVTLFGIFLTPVFFFIIDWLGQKHFFCPPFQAAREPRIVGRAQLADPLDGTSRLAPRHGRHEAALPRSFSEMAGRNGRSHRRQRHDSAPAAASDAKATGWADAPAVGRAERNDRGISDEDPPRRTETRVTKIRLEETMVNPLASGWLFVPPRRNSSFRGLRSSSSVTSPGRSLRVLELLHQSADLRLCAVDHHHAAGASPCSLPVAQYPEITPPTVEV